MAEELECDIPCPEGYYLGLVPMDEDYEFWESKCLRCPAHTYSLGGSFVVNGDNEEWEFSQPGFTTTCYTNDGGEWEREGDCDPWSGEWGTSIRTGASGDDVLTVFELKYGATFVTDGFVNFRYRSTTRQTLEGLTKNGDFKVFVDGELVYQDFDKHDIDWHKVEIDVDEGYREVTFLY